MVDRSLRYAVVVEARGSRETAADLAAIGAAGRRAGDRVESGAREATEGLRRLDTQTERTSAGIRGIGTAAAALGVGLGLGELVQAGRAAVATAAQMEGLERRIAGFAGGSEQAQTVLRGLRQEAFALGAGFGRISEGYAQLLPLQQAGILASEQQQAIYRGLIDVQAATGASAAQVGQTMFGLAQGLSAGVLRAEELNQVTEPLPGLLNALDRAAGLPAGGFRRLVNAGEVTSAMFRDTLIAALEEYQGAAAAAATGVAASLNRVGDAVTALQNAAVDRDLVAGTANRVAEVLQVWAGASDVLGESRERAEANAEAIERLAAIIATVLIARGLGPLTARLAVAAAAQARHTAAVIADTAAMGRQAAAARVSAAAMATLRNAMAFLGGPVGLAITGLAAGFLLLGERQSAADQVAQQHNQTLRLQDELTGDLARGVEALAGQYRVMTEEMREVERLSLSAVLRSQREEIARLHDQVRETAEAYGVLFSRRRDGSLNLRDDFDLPAAAGQEVRRLLADFERGGELTPDGFRGLASRIGEIASATGSADLQRFAEELAAVAAAGAETGEALERTQARVVLLTRGVDALTDRQRALLDITEQTTRATDDHAAAQARVARAMDDQAFTSLIDRLRETRETMGATAVQALRWRLETEGASGAQTELAVRLQALIAAQQDYRDAVEDGRAEEIARAETAVRALTIEYAAAERALAFRNALNQAVADGVPMYAALQVAASAAAEAEGAILERIDAVLAQLRQSVRVQSVATNSQSELTRARERDVEVLQSLNRELERLSLSEREAAIAEAVARLSQQATPDQRTEVARRAGRVFDIRSADRIRAETQTEIEAYGDAVAQLDRLLQQGDITQETYNRRLDQLRAQILPQARDAAAQYRQEMERLRAAAQAGAISQTQFAEASEQARDRALQASEDWRAGAIRALEDFARSAGDHAQAAERAVTRVLGGLEDTIVQFATTGELSVGKMVDAIIADFARLTIRQTITAPLAGAASQIIQGLFGAPFAMGGAFEGGRPLQRFATGSVVSRPTTFAMASGRTGLMGEAGPEAILPLRRLSNGRLGVEAAGGGASYIINVDARGASDPAEVEAAGYRGAQRALAEQLPGVVRLAAQHGHARTVADWQRRGGRFR